MNDELLLVLGHVSGVFGVKGWLKIYSETDPVQNILKYDPWFIKKNNSWVEIKLLDGKKHKKGVIVQFDGYLDRDVAAELKGCEIAIKREQLPETLSENEFYWADLEGLRVEGIDKFYFGEISHLFQTGANDVVVIKGDKEYLVPYVWEQVIKSVDLEKGLMIIDWDSDF